MRKRQQRTADASGLVRKSVAYESVVSEGVQYSDCVILMKYDLVTQLLHQLLHIYKIYKMYTLKTLRHVSVLGPSSGSHIVLAKVTLISLYQLGVVAACRVV